MGRPFPVLTFGCLRHDLSRLTGALVASHSSVLPNRTVMPNHMPKPNQSRPAVERTLEAFELFQQRLMSAHAPEFAALDITMAQAKLVYVVTAAGELSMSEIAQRLGVTSSTASGAVDHLVALGYLARIDDPANRRQVQVSVTPLGLDTLEHLRELNTRQLRELFGVLSDADLGVVEHATRIMTMAVSTAADRGAALPAPDPDAALATNPTPTPRSRA